MQPIPLLASANLVSGGPNIVGSYYRSQFQPCLTSLRALECSEIPNAAGFSVLPPAEKLCRVLLGGGCSSCPRQPEQSLPEDSECPQDRACIQQNQYSLCAL